MPRAGTVVAEGAPADGTPAGSAPAEGGALVAPPGTTRASGTITVNDTIAW